MNKEAIRDIKAILESVEKSVDRLNESKKPFTIITDGREGSLKKVLESLEKEVEKEELKEAGLGEFNASHPNNSMEMQTSMFQSGASTVIKRLKEYMSNPNPNNQQDAYLAVSGIEWTIKALKHILEKK